MKIKRKQITANSKMSRRRITAATESGMKIYVDGKAVVDVYEDDYNEGEGDYVNGWDFDIRGAYDTIQQLVNKLAEYGFSENPDDYVFLDGTIQSDAFQDADGMEPSDADIEAWKRGEIQLYNAHLVLPLGVGSAIHQMTEEEAEAFGLSVY